MFNDGNLSKDSITWRLWRVSKVENMKVSILASVKVNGSEQIFVRSFRGISIVYSVGEMLINTVGHFDECVNAEKNDRDEYILEKMKIQPEVLDLLRCLPMSAGLGVRRDVWGVQEFYSLVSGTKVILENGFVDLTSLAVLAGYKFHSKNMTTLGVQVIGTLLNKMVSTGNERWGRSGA